MTTTFQGLANSSPILHETYTLLAIDGPKTLKGIRAANGLPRRTLYRILRELLARGLITAHPYFRDMRQTLYMVAP